MEQASSHQVAQFRALEIEKVLGSDFSSADMTGGMGIDTLLLSDYGRRSVTYIERNSELCTLAERNFSRVCGEGCRITVVNADSVEYLSNAERFDFIYADPARRSTTGRKLVSISDCEPDLLPHIDSLLCKCTLMGVKLSPMLDISVALKELRHVQRLYVIGLDGECKAIDFKEVRGTKGIKEAEYTVGGVTVKVAVASGLANARTVVDSIISGEKDYNFVEIMACPGGCINGGGQPVVSDSIRNYVDLKTERAKALYDVDSSIELRRSHESPVMKLLYDEYFENPGSHKAHELLHTTYVKRGK